MPQLFDPQHIREFATDSKHFQGQQLIDLYNHIQASGHELLFSEPHRFNGAKAFQFSETELIAIVRTGPSKSFFPCVLRTIIIPLSQVRLIST